MTDSFRQDSQIAMATGRRLEVGGSGGTIEARERCLFHAEFERQGLDSAHEGGDGGGTACCRDSGMTRYRATAGFCQVARVLTLVGVATGSCQFSTGLLLGGRLAGVAVRLV